MKIGEIWKWKKEIPFLVKIQKFDDDYVWVRIHNTAENIENYSKHLLRGTFGQERNRFVKVQVNNLKTGWSVNRKIFLEIYEKVY